MIPCVPNELITSVHDSKTGPQQDAMLLWLEEHAHRLEKGMIKLREEGTIRSISQFPEQPPLCSSATTSGVQVCASVVFVSEFSDLVEEANKYLFALSLKPEGCVVHGMFHESCQLCWRQWIIKTNDQVVEDVNGEAVLGQILNPKMGIYQSKLGSGKKTQILKMPSFFCYAIGNDIAYVIHSGRGSEVVANSGDVGAGEGGGGEESNGGDQKREKDGKVRVRGERRRSKPNPRLSNPTKNIHGEQVAAGWPAWLSAVAGEAINGWIPRRADTFEKIDKIGQDTYSNVYKAKDTMTGKIVALKKVRFDNLELVHG